MVIKMRILLLEDDIEAARYLGAGLEQEGFLVTHCDSSEKANIVLEANGFDAYIIDIMLPGQDGISFIEHLRQRNDNTPILILSARHTLDDRIRGLKTGGDDYLVKPYAFVELLARLQALLRRAHPQRSSSQLKIDNLVLDRMKRQVWRNEQEIILQNRDFSLLEYLMEHQDEVVTRTMLLEAIWGLHFDPQTNVVDVHICRLREKIDRNFSPALLHTVRGAGYVLKAPK